MLTIDEAIAVLHKDTPVEVPYRTQKGCRGLTRRVETEDYWITLSVSEKPTKAWLDRFIEEVLADENR